MHKKDALAEARRMIERAQTAERYAIRHKTNDEEARKHYTRGLLDMHSLLCKITSA